LAGQLADYEVMSTVIDEGTVSCLSTQRPARLGPGEPVTVWVVGPSARSPWAMARDRLLPVAAVRGEGLPDWLEAGAAGWGGRSVVWVSATDRVTATLASAPPGMSVADRMRAVAQAAQGAEALHQKGVLHGAISPQAVALAGPTGPALLAPPSLADGQRLLAQVGYPRLGFVDPQLLRGQGGRWSDIWALGATLHQVVTGRAAFPGIDELPVVQALSQLMSSPAPALGELPDAVAELVSACLSPDPADRPPTAAEVARRTNEAATQW
jgi:hypothetical protein